MADETKNNDTSFLEQKSGPKLHVKDVLFILLRNIHWLIICGVLGAAIAGYTVRHQNRVYASSARVLIKGTSTNNNAESTMREASVRNMFSTAGSASKYSLYNESIASFKTGDLYDHKDAQGFITLFGLPLKVRAMMEQSIGEGQAILESKSFKKRPTE